METDYSFSTFRRAWKDTVAFLKRLGSFRLSLIVIVTLAYGLLSDPSHHGLFGYQFQWLLKSGALVVCVIACVRYVVLARNGQNALFQWPIKIVLSSISAIVIAFIGLFLIWALIGNGGTAATIAGSQAVGLLFTLAFAMTWGALGDIFRTRSAGTRTLYAAGIALTAQLLVSIGAFVISTGPDVLSDVGAPGLGAAAVGVYFGAVLAPPVIGMLAFQFVLLVMWLSAGRTENGEIKETGV